MVNRLSPTLFERRCKRQPALDASANDWRRVGCWLWPGGGRAIAILGTTWAAGRAAWHVHCGPVPSGMHVRSYCESPGCCEPEHLFLASPNAQREGSSRPAPGTERVRKLRAADVARILTGGEPAAVVAEALGVTRSHISRVRAGRRKEHTATSLPRRAPRPYGLDRRRLAPRLR